MSGWFALTRDFHDHPAITGCAGRVSIWAFLVGRAAWKDTRIDVHGTTVPVPRGSICISTRELAERTFTTHQVVRTALERFKRHGLIRTDVTQGRTIITLCNYDKYQQGGDAPNTPPNTAATQQQHIKGQETRGQGREDASHPRGADDFSASEPDPKVFPADDIAEAVQVYALAADRSAWPKIAKLTDARRKALRGRLKDAGGIEGWRAAIAKAEASNFLCGGTGWGGFSFDWLVKQANFFKLMEGNYDNRSGNGGSARGGMAGGASPGRGRAAASIASIVAQSRLARQV